MDGANRSPRRLVTRLALWCVLAGSALAQPPAHPPVAPTPMAMASKGPLFSPPTAPDGTIGCDTTVPQFIAPPSGDGMPPGPGGPWQQGGERHWLFQHLDLRHSSTHGRAMGPGEPLRGTSWMNRPVSLSLDGGALFMASRPADNVRANNDLFGAIGAGWDFDHYWGAQLRVGWATPDLVNTLHTDMATHDNLFITDLSLLYYPWGDSKLRPYYRFGVGLTSLKYVNDNALTINSSMYTLPLGVGLKYLIHPKLAWRLELMDNIAFGQNETDTLNNFTLTTGFEWKLGGPPSNYWAWEPRGGAW